MDKVYDLDWNSSASKDECTAAVGFKWMLNQVMTWSVFSCFILFFISFHRYGCGVAVKSNIHMFSSDASGLDLFIVFHA
jgi:hypothetical protein